MFLPHWLCAVLWQPHSRLRIFYLWCPLFPNIHRAQSLTIFHSLLKCCLRGLHWDYLKLNVCLTPALPTLLTVFFSLQCLLLAHVPFTLLVGLTDWLFPTLEFKLYATSFFKKFILFVILSRNRSRFCEFWTSYCVEISLKNIKSGNYLEWVEIL